MRLLIGSACIAWSSSDLPAARDPDWLAHVQEQIAAREYRASENGEGLQAPNRAHNLRTYFERTGIRVHDRTAAGSMELLGLSLVGIGRADALAATGPAEEIRTGEGSRVELHRKGVVEWYENSAVGLEQGFTLAERPEGAGPLVVELAVAHARATLSGDAVRLDTGARKLRYGALAASDATGVTLAARFDLSGDRLRISVDDANATYPVAIDPLLTETDDAQLEANQADASLGTSVSAAGDVNGDGYADVIIGAPSYDAGQTDEGAAFVFHGSASGIADGNPLTATAQLESDQGGAAFGWSVADAGDVNGDGYADVVVGAHLYDNGTSDEGAAFVFHGSASGLGDGNPATAAAVLDSNQGGSGFGKAVAGAGDVNGDGYGDVIVGAGSYDAGQGVGEGAAFVFHGSASGVGNQSPATAAGVLESNQSNAALGLAVAGAGDVNGDGYGDVIVGASLYDAGQTDEGAAFVFHGGASGIGNGNPGTAAAQLEANQASARFGESAGSAGDVNGDGYGDVIVGASFYDAGQSDEGAAFVFHGSASGIANGNPATAPTQLEANQANARLGGSVAGAGDLNGDGYADVIVGAAYYDAGQADEGAAFVFLGSGSGVADGNPLTATAQLETDQADAQLGTSVAEAGDVNGDGFADVIVGGPQYDAGQSNEGAAFVYLGGASGIADGNPTTAAAQLDSDQGGAEIGHSVAGAGDVNGDGYDDVIVGAWRYDAGQSDEGAAFVFLGSASGIADGNPTTAAAQLESNQASANFGYSVAGAADVNGDGYADVVVGARYYDAGQSDEGAAFVFLGSATGISDGNPTTAAARLESNQADAQLGVSVAGAGDVNGDGYADVIVSASYYDAGQSDEGAAFVFQGSASGIANGNPTTAATQLESDQANAVFGSGVAGAGDVNGDGYADVIVGAYLYDAGQTNEGAAFVFLGSASGVADASPTTAAAQLESDQAGAELGHSVSTGDVNGDGYADVIVGAPSYDAGQTDEGAAFVFLGSASGIADGNPATAAAQLESNQQDAGLGKSVAIAGDVNGDGYGDAIAGAYQYDAGLGGHHGIALVFLGSATGIADGNPATAAAQLESDTEDAHLGKYVGGAGDVNGDGYADVIAGAPYYNLGEGAAFVFTGNSAGRPVLARQRRGDGSGTAVQPWGGAYSGTGFAAELRANHPQGRGRVKAQLQACPPGVPFGHASCANALTPSWVAVTGATPDVAISHTFTGLTSNKLYRWRARVLQAPATGPLPANPAHGPWRRLGAQSVEADTRLPEPGFLLSLASGVALVAALARRRSRSLR